MINTIEKDCIAVIGMEGKFPEADNVFEFYHNLVNGKDSIRPISHSRKKSTGLSVEKEYRPIGFIEDIDHFDHEFFNISKKEARNISPQHRIVLEVVYRTFENAGYSVDDFQGSDTSVFISSTGLDYIKLAKHSDPTLRVGNLNSTMAGRVSRFFDLRGGSVMIDTACSSSLVAVHYACREILSGDAECALACGVKLHVFPPLQDLTDDMGISSKDGKTRSFSSDASGTGSGEAVACVLLKSLKKAISDGDIIHAVIRGSAVNQDAALSSTLTAPDSRAQCAVIKKAWYNAGIDPADVGYIEAHGTATELGDPIEVKGIDLAFSDFTSKKKFCSISSVKSNFGHTDSAAGICGMVKAVLSIKHGILFPSLHYKKQNPFIDFENSAVYVNTETKSWDVPPHKKRVAGVSSFGISGTNCHVVLEEPPSFIRADEMFEHCIATLSAKCPSSLASNVEMLRSRLSQSDHLQLKNLCYTLSVGRKHYPYRCSFPVRSKEDLIQKLNDFELAGVKPHMPDQKYILVFSLYVPSAESDINSQIKEQPSFKSAYQDCANACSDISSPWFKAFASQYALYKTLESEGLAIKNIIGDEFGKLIISALKNTISIKDAIDKGKSVHESNDLRERLEKFIDREADANLIYFSFLRSCTIIKTLGEISQVKSTFRLCCLHTEAPNSFEDIISSLYNHGFPVEWKSYNGHKGGVKIELPGYSFKETRCWLDDTPANTEMVMHLDNFIYSLSWNPQPLQPTRAETYKGVTVLICRPSLRLGKAVAEMITTSGGHAITIDLSHEFSKKSETIFSIDENCEEDFEKIARLILLSGDWPIRIIYLTSINSNVNPCSKEGLCDVRVTNSLWKAFKLNGKDRKFSFVLVTAGANKVTDNDTLSSPFNGLHATILKGLQTEDPAQIVKHIDLTETVSAGQKAGEIVSELAEQDRFCYVAYRNGVRYIPEIKKLDSGLEKTPLKIFKSNDTYLVVGGASGITLEICKSIITEVGKCSFVIIGRTDLSNDISEENPPKGIVERRQALKSLRDLGAQVTYFSADISDITEIRNIKERIAYEIPSIDGVIFGAGVTSRFTPFHEKDYDEITQVLKPKIHGLINLEILLQDRQPKFIVLFSSLGSIVPNKFTTDYSVANAFLNAYATFMHQSGRPFTSINWPGWREVGMSSKKLTEDNNEMSLSIDEGVKLFRRALDLRHPEVIISKVDLNDFRINPFFKVSEAVEQNSSVNVVSVTEENPDRDIKSVLRAIWYDVLEAEGLEDGDDFFDLGGHSLNGNQLIVRVEKEFQVKLEFEDLFDYSTIQLMADRISTLQAAEEKIHYEEIPSVGAQDYYEPSHAQKRLWVIHQFDDDKTAYNMPGAFLIKGQLDVDIFERVFQLILNRHEIFRTTFHVVNEALVQKVNAYQTCNNPIIKYDFENIERKVELALIDLVDSEINYKFDLSTGPLVRITLARISASQHFFLFNMHHIISDGWSTSIFLREMVQGYNTLIRGESLTWSPLRKQYKDFAAWQNAKLKGDALDKDRKYWLSVFNEGIPVLNFPSDFIRPVIKSYTGDKVGFELEQNLLINLRRLAKESGGTIFMVLVSLLNILLLKYTGQRKFVIGTPVGGREHVDLEDQIGLYVNTIPLLNQVDPQSTVLELMGGVKSAMIGAFDHQLYPFDLLVEELNVQRDLSRSPVFDVMVIFQNNTIGLNNIENTDGLQLSNWGAAKPVSKFDFTFIFNETKDSLYGAIEFNTDIYLKDRVKQMSQHFIRIAEVVGSNNSIKVKDLSFLDQDELNKQLIDFNSTITTIPEKTIIDLFEEKVAQSPHKTAVSFNGQFYSYQYIQEKSNFLANYLVAHCQIEPEEPVAVVLNRSEWIVISIIAVMKAGGTYLPIDPQFPVERISLMANNSKARIALISATYSNLLDLLKGESKYLQHCIVVEDGVEPVVEKPAVNEMIRAENGLVTSGLTNNHVSPLIEKVHKFKVQMQRGQEGDRSLNFSRPVKPEQLAYIIYTSGSTGEPKGVAVQHKSLTNFLISMGRDPGIDCNDRFIALTTFSFDISLLELLLPLAYGAQVVMVANDIQKDPLAIINKINEEEVTMMQATPTWWNFLLECGWKENGIIKKILCGGERLKPELGKKLLEKNIALWNLYGPTETTIWSVAKRINSHEGLDVIGKPIDNTQIYILDEDLTPMPVGAIGEIFIGGIGVAQGYYNNKELTEKRFLKNPFAEGKIYRTGDLGRWSTNANLQFLGRSDDQVKIRGFRIELAEIESRLMRYEGIRNAVVSTFPSDLKNEGLCAYILSDRVTITEDVKVFLSKFLPEYMIPEWIIQLQDFPLTANGKIDKKRLPVPSISPAQPLQAMAENHTQEKLLACWSDVLQVNETGIDKNFFELGGNSVKAIKLQNKIYHEFDLQIPLKEIFQYPTIRRFAERIASYSKEPVNSN